MFGTVSAVSRLRRPCVGGTTPDSYCPGMVNCHTSPTREQGNPLLALRASVICYAAGAIPVAYGNESVEECGTFRIAATPRPKQNARVRFRPRQTAVL